MSSGVYLEDQDLPPELAACDVVEASGLDRDPARAKKLALTFLRAGCRERGRVLCEQSDAPVALGDGLWRVDARAWCAPRLALRVVPPDGGELP